MKPSRITYDPLYGFIKLTETEDKIIHSPYYQRLRWIKQLGFSSYIFPGAEHNRFAHAMGVMHVADKMVHAIGYHVPDEKLFDVKAQDEASKLHKSIRIAALLHDIGTFPFSHTCEGAYIRHGESSFKAKERGKDLPNNHEHLGAFILKNTDCENGITRILQEDGLDPNEISKIVKGESKILLANQLLHSEVDADRIDYLMRDAHYTGVKYGHLDRDYILYHLTTFDSGDGKPSLAFKENALHAVEDLLIARFGWYSQIVRTSGGARFDIIAETITKYFLEKKLIWQFQDLLEMARNKPDAFFGFNDFYFMNILHKQHVEKKVKNPMIAEMIEMLLYRKSPIEVQLPLFEHRLLARNKEGKRKRENLVKKINDVVKSFEEILKQNGDPSAWILHDIPNSDIVFAKSVGDIVDSRDNDNLLQLRDPVKFVDHEGNPSLLVEKEHSVIRLLSSVGNFIPAIYMNQKAYEALKNTDAFQELKAEKNGSGKR